MKAASMSMPSDSMPSDVTPDVSEEMARDPRPSRRRDGRWSGEQRGLLFAAVVAFLGIAYVGPTLGRITRKPRIADRAAFRLEDARRRARKARDKLHKRARRLGGGPIR